MKYKAGDKVKIKSFDWYNENKDEGGYINCGSRAFFTKMSDWCGEILTINRVVEEFEYYCVSECIFSWTDEMIECKIEEEETPKFKVNDIVFVKNIGWVRITNSYWDSLANECIYEAIGFNGEGEYDCISQSNIEGQMLPESENPHTGGNKITLDEYKNNDKEWLFNKLAMLDNITALESIQDIFNHLQQSKYPKTYKECCEVLDIDAYDLVLSIDYRSNKMKHNDWKRLEKLNALNQILICRDAYWKLYGEEMGLGKPWEPEDLRYVYSFFRWDGDITMSNTCYGNNHIFEFPTEEMRDSFYENFKEEIEICKELL